MTPRRDNCPRCLTRDIQPAAWDDLDDGGQHCRYRCRTCGHAWTTTWAPDVDPTNLAGYSPDDDPPDDPEDQPGYWHTDDPYARPPW